MSKEYSYNDYTLYLTPKSDRLLDISIHSKSSAYSSENYELTRITVKTIEAALQEKSKQLSFAMKETKVEENEVLELSIHYEVQFLPKVTEVLYIPLIKHMNQAEMIIEESIGIKKRILAHTSRLTQITPKTSIKMAYLEEIKYYGAEQKEFSGLALSIGNYIITVSSFLTPNTSNYLSVGITNALMIPGECKNFSHSDYFVSPDSQQSVMPFFIRSVIEVKEDKQNIIFWAKDQNFTMKNFIMTAERI